VQVDAYFVTMSYFNIAIDGETSAHAWGDTLAQSRTHTITVYNAAYLELARRLALPLASIDTTLLRAAGAVGVPIFTP
jgi:predicted nucleic acid-binding protein